MAEGGTTPLESEHAMDGSAKMPDDRAPKSRRAPAMPVRPVEPEAYLLKDDGTIPNHPHFPLLIYRSAVRLPAGTDPHEVFEKLFAQNGWGEAWRDGIYDYAHFHAHKHEVLGIARGRVLVRFGGANGREINVKAGDVIVLPAGVGHQRIKASKNLAVVGAYPPQGAYDEKRSVKGHAEMREAIRHVPVPSNDPVYGPNGPVRSYWAKRG